MKKTLLITSFAITCIGSNALAQDIPQSQVPSVIVNNFQQSFPKAFDVEWELKGDIYEVEFETGFLGKDHEVWFEKSGKQIRHKEELSKSDLPQKVLAAINSNYSGYRVDNVKKITEGSKISYTVELKSRREEWKVAFDNEGNILSKIAD